MKYIIGSGWWCTDSNDDTYIRKAFGSNLIRSKEFHELWYKSIYFYTKPDKIIIVDSASPIKPKLPNNKTIEFVSLNVNAGHATNSTGHLCGWTRSVILSMQYAYLCECDYYVYVEQDTLLKGKNIVEHCINYMKRPYMFGSGDGTPQILQQSFFIIKKEYINRFIINYLKIPYSDKVLSPEVKFAIATSKFLSDNFHYLKVLPHNLLMKLIRKLTCYDRLPIKYGRARPIDFNDKYFYFQHGSKEEISQYLKLLNN